MTVQQNTMKAALAATLMGSLLLVACGGSDDNSTVTAVATSSKASSSVTSSAAASSAATSSAASSAATSSAAASSAAASSAATSSAAASSAATSSAAASSVAASSAATSSAASSSAAATSPFASSALDSSGFYWFKSANDTLSLGYLVGEGDADASGNRILTGTATANSGEFIRAYPNSLSTVTNTIYNAILTPAKSDGSLTSSYTGTITISKATSAGASDGGYIVFQLPKVTTMALYHFTTGTPYFSVEVSADSGATWTTKLAMGKIQSSAGGYTADISSYVASTSSVWVRIRNGGTGGLNIQGVKIVY